MIRRLTLTASWFLADPVRVRLAICTLVLALALMALIMPGLHILADDVSGGSHP
jgi:hypothetical protein